MSKINSFSKINFPQRILRKLFIYLLKINALYKFWGYPYSISQYASYYHKLLLIFYVLSGNQL